MMYPLNAFLEARSINKIESFHKHPHLCHYQSSSHLSLCLLPRTAGRRAERSTTSVCRWSSSCCCWWWWWWFWDLLINQTSRSLNKSQTCQVLSAATTTKKKKQWPPASRTSPPVKALFSSFRFLSWLWRDASASNTERQTLPPRDGDDAWSTTVTLATDHWVSEQESYFVRADIIKTLWRTLWDELLTTVTQ